jgi:hypothetical protein
MKKVIALFSVAIAFTPFTHASSSLEAQIKKCADERDSLARLVCYDKIGKGIASKATRATLSADSKVQQQAASITQSKAPVATAKVTTKEDAFGKEHLKKSAAEINNDISEIKLTIKSISKNVYDKMTLTFTNGQKWKQTDSVKYRLSAGNEVLLKKGTLGTVYLSKPGTSKTMKVKRIK